MFQSMGYVTDVCRGKLQAERNFFRLSLFVSFFPQLVAGPIERPSNLIPQLKDPHPCQKNDMLKGAKHMLVGFFKKIVVADTISVYVDAVYHNPEGATGLGVLMRRCCLPCRFIATSQVIPTSPSVVRALWASV